MDQPGKVANPARGQLNRGNSIPLSPCVPENLVSRDGFSQSLDTDDFYMVLVSIQHSAQYALQQSTGMHFLLQLQSKRDARLRFWSNYLYMKVGHAHRTVVLW